MVYVVLSSYPDSFSFVAGDWQHVYKCRSQWHPMLRLEPRVAPLLTKNNKTSLRYILRCGCEHSVLCCAFRPRVKTAAARSMHLQLSMYFAGLKVVLAELRTGARTTMIYTWGTQRTHVAGFSDFRNGWKGYPMVHAERVCWVGRSPIIARLSHVEEKETSMVVFKELISQNRMPLYLEQSECRLETEAIKSSGAVLITSLRVEKHEGKHIGRQTPVVCSRALWGFPINNAKEYGVTANLLDVRPGI